MDADDADRITRRAPGRWRVWAACFLMSLDGFFVPAWLIPVGATLMGSRGAIELSGQVVPLWFVLAMGVMAILSALGVVAIALQTNFVGWRIVTTVAVAWVVFYAVAWLAGTRDVGAIGGRLLVLGLLFWGRGPFLPEERRTRAAGAPAPGA